MTGAKFGKGTLKTIYESIYGRYDPKDSYVNLFFFEALALVSFIMILIFAI